MPEPSTSGRASRVDAAVTAEPIDFAAVMADHRPAAAHGAWCGSSYCEDAAAPWPCEPYRLAVEAERLAGKVARVEELRDDWRQRAASARDATDDDWAGDGWTDVADEIDAALADQPEQTQPHPCCDATHPHYGQVQP